MTVEVLYGGADLIDVALNFKLVESLSAAKEFVERLVLAQLEKDVNVFGVFEEVFKTDDVVLVERAVDFDFRHQLLFGSSLRKGGLGNDFGGRHTLVLQVGELEAASETALAQELALEVLLDADLAVIFDDFLFDDRLGSVNAFFWMALLHCSYFFLVNSIKKLQNYKTFSVGK